MISRIRPLPRPAVHKNIANEAEKILSVVLKVISSTLSKTYEKHENISHSVNDYEKKN